MDGVKERCRRSAAEQLSEQTLRVRKPAVVDLGRPGPIDVDEILAAIAAETGREVPHVVKPRRAGDPTYLVADPSAARATLNFHPAHSDLATIIRTAWAWHKKAHPLKTGTPVRE